jgi:hypothetical protein
MCNDASWNLWQHSRKKKLLQSKIEGNRQTTPPEFGPNKWRPLFGQYLMYWLNIGPQYWSTDIWPVHPVLAKYWMHIDRIIRDFCARLDLEIFEGGAGVTSSEWLFSYPHPAATWLLFRTHLSPNRLETLHTYSCPIPASPPRVLARNRPSSISHKQFQSGRRTLLQLASTALICI